MSEPVQIILPKVVEEKMEAIVNLSKAIRDVASALVSVNVQVLIQDNVFTGQDTAIQIGAQE